MPDPTRLMTADDAPLLARLHAANRVFMAPFDALRSDAFYTRPGQVEEVRRLLERHAAGTSLPHVILDATREVVGRITLNGIARGPMQSCSLGYWVSQDANGRGLATAAVAHVLGIAFDDLRLHRVQAETLVDNERSQRVLAKNGFDRIGMAPAFLEIAGRWQDHLLFQRLAPHRT